MLPLSNVIEISVDMGQSGLGEFNVNNLALFTSDQFLSNLDGDSYRVYLSPAEVATDFGLDTETYRQAAAVFSQSPNILAGNGCLIIIPTIVYIAETVLQAISRTKDMIYYCGVICTDYDADMEALAAEVQSLGDKILLYASANYSDVAGIFTDIAEAAYDRTRCLLYTPSDEDARLMAAAAAGKGFSRNFNAANNAMTLHLKRLTGIDPDEAITQTRLTACKTAGVDVYVSTAGVPGYYSHGANRYFDSIYNLVWLVNALKVAGFNALATVGTKIPQTEPGMDVLKGAYRRICEQARTFGYIAPGQWNSSTWFGDQPSMDLNILEHGYYIYSQPVNLQSQVDRQARIAPLIQIAIKEAGAIHKSSVIVNINA